MAEAIRRNGPFAACTSLVIVLSLFTAALALAGVNLAQYVPMADWASLADVSQTADIGRLLAWESFLPRAVVSLLAGAGLALAGVLFQNVLRNPLAEPATIGVAGGAQLALIAATLWQPELAGTLGAEGIAFVGGLLAVCITITIGSGRNFSPARLIVAGIFISLYCGSISGVLILFHQNYLTGVLLWNSGSLVQNGWDATGQLTIRGALVVAIAVLMTRPLSLLSLGDEAARGLGINVAAIRLLTLLLAVFLTASIVSMVGTIAFIGLAAPAIARAGGARGVSQQLLVAPLIGAGLLCLTDQLVQLAPLAREIPTGAATALFGAPLLLWLLPRLRATSVPSTQSPDQAVRNRHSARWLLAGLCLLLITLWAALAFGRGPDGWAWLSGSDLADMLQWRWPRVVAVGMAGGMLAAAGVLMQRMTANPLASPEVLGISSGAALGLIVLLFATPAPDSYARFLACTAGSTLTLFVILLSGRKSGFRPEQMLLVGIAVSTLFSALAAVLMASGDPRMTVLLGWMAGSTYTVTSSQALATAFIGMGLLALVPLLVRPLAILPLGPVFSHAIGLSVTRIRFLLLLLTAALTAAATLTVGPLTFVGLLAPHLARLSGFQRPGEHLAASILLGSSVMIAADWFGRMAIFPYQIPAGLFATFLAGPFFLFFLQRQK